MPCRPQKFGKDAAMSPKKLRPASEEVGGLFFLLPFSAIWYLTLLRVSLASGFQPVLLLFFAFGLLPLETAFRQMRRAARARRRHRKALEEISPLPGTIRGILRQAVPVRGSRGRISFVFQYVLQVEFWEPGASAPRQITSEPYRRPVQNFLASDRIRVYPLPDGWHFVLDGFDIKERREDPGPFPPEENPSQASPLVHGVFLLFCLYVLYQILAP